MENQSTILVVRLVVMPTSRPGVMNMPNFFQSLSGDQLVYARSIPHIPTDLVLTLTRTIDP